MGYSPARWLPLAGNPKPWLRRPVLLGALQSRPFQTHSYWQIRRRSLLPRLLVRLLLDLLFRRSPLRNSVPLRRRCCQPDSSERRLVEGPFEAGLLAQTVFLGGPGVCSFVRHARSHALSSDSARPNHTYPLFRRQRLVDGSVREGRPRSRACQLGSNAADHGNSLLRKTPTLEASSGSSSCLCRGKSFGCPFDFRRRRCAASGVGEGSNSSRSRRSRTLPWIHESNTVARRVHRRGSYGTAIGI